VRVGLGATAAVATLSAGLASAQAQVSLETQVTARVVEVNTPFQIRLSALSSSDDTPQNPRITLPPGVAVQGPSISTQNNISFVNGRVSRQQGITATWLLSIAAAGKYRLGPAEVTIGGQRHVDRAFEIEVVAQGQAPSPRRGGRRPLPFDPFDDLFGHDPLSGPMFPPGFGRDLLRASPEPEPSDWPRELTIASARDPIAFLDARVNKREVVLGEQLWFEVFAYGKPGPFEESGVREPSRDDFLSYTAEPEEVDKLFALRIGEELWYGTRSRKYVLFPLRTGALSLGSMEIRFGAHPQAGRGRYHNVVRRSQPLTVLVKEPPLGGRPVGYRLGDVGHFELTATVEPRRARRGEAISVSVSVSGRGRLPERLSPPEQAGIDWLEPTVTTDQSLREGHLAGSRSFHYVVRLGNSGSIDLGAFRFPHWDPSHKTYRVAEAKLGAVEVEESSAPAAERAEPAHGGLGGEIRPRNRLGPLEPKRRFFADSPGFFAALLGAPLLVLSGLGLGRGFSAAARRLAKRRVSLAREVARELDRATAEARLGHPAQSAAALERAVERSLERPLGGPARGIVRTELGTRLEQAGCPSALIERVLALLLCLDDLRFANGDGKDLTALIEEARALCQRLLSATPTRTRTA